MQNGKERNADHSVLKGVKTAGEAAGQTPPMVSAAASDRAGFAARLFPYRFLLVHLRHCSFFTKSFLCPVG